MKGLYEMLEGFDEKGFEEWRMEKDKRKKLLSEKEVMDAIAKATAEAVNAAYEEESRGAVMIRMVLKMNSLIEKLFPEEPAENPDAEKPIEEPDAEKPELSVLEELLFERTRLAVIQHDNGGRSAVQYGRFSGLYDLIRDAGLEARYYAWKEEHGYEKT